MLRARGVGQNVHSASARLSAKVACQPSSVSYRMTSTLTRRALGLLPLALLSGCNMVVMNASGDIARQQGQLVVVSTLMMLIIVPVIVLTLLFAWRYRQNNRKAKYEPDWDHSTQLELVIWGAPLLIIIALGLLTWISTHLLDPYRPLQRIDETRQVQAE